MAIQPTHWHVEQNTQWRIYNVFRRSETILVSDMDI